MAVALQVIGVQTVDLSWGRNRSVFINGGSNGSELLNCTWGHQQEWQLLLNCVDMVIQDVFYTLPNTGETYTTAKEKITAYFTLRKNTSHNRHMFRRQSNRTERVLDLAAAMETSEQRE